MYPISIFIAILFYRNPTWIKNILRPIRVGLGPTSILATLCISGTQIWAGGMFQTTLSLGIFLSTFLAGCVFRPDNQEVINALTAAIPMIAQLFPPQTLYSTLKCVHGGLNIVSVLISIVILFCNTL